MLPKEIIHSFQTISCDMILQEQLAAIGSLSQCYALMELAQAKAMTVVQLADALHLEKSTVSRLVTTLIQKKLCSWSRTKVDQRAKLIVLTEQGHICIQNIHAIVALHIQQILQTMPEQEQQCIVQGLALYTQAVQKARIQRECTIRNLTPKDSIPLRALIQQVNPKIDQKYPPALFTLVSDEINHIVHTYTKKNRAYFVLVHHKTILGGVGYQPYHTDTHDMTCKIVGLHITPHIRHLGLGSLLMQHAMQHAKGIGFTRCYVETYNCKPDGQTFYKQLGFASLSEPWGHTHPKANRWYGKDL